VLDRVNYLQQLEVSEEKAMMTEETYQKQIHKLCLAAMKRKG